MQVDRDIKKPFNYFLQRESIANVNMLTNPENDDKTKKTPSKMGIFLAENLPFTLSLDLRAPDTDRKVSGDRVLSSEK